MQEGDKLVVRSAFGFPIERNKALAFKSLYFGKNIIYLKGDVMDAFATFFDEFGNRTVWVGGLQQFNFTFANLEEGGGDPLTFNGFYFVVSIAEELAKKFVAIGHAFYGNADVVNSYHGWERVEGMTNLGLLRMLDLLKTVIAS
jgi:hypothetical protein